MLTSPDKLEQIDHAIETIFPRLVEIRRHLHQNPELSGEEYETTKFISEQLREFEIAHEYEDKQRGIVSHSGHGNAIVGLRGDIDAIRVVENNELNFKSCVPGVMHACGHDAHTSILLGAMYALKQVSPEGVNVRGIFQPAEEIGTGALDMVSRGAIDGLKGIFAVHVDPSRPIGKIGSRPKTNSAFCDEIKIKITGKGGHGARPHETNDPVAAAVSLIHTVYAQVPRNINSRNSLVVTFGKIAGANQLNVIPGEILLEGTIRSLDQESRDIAVASIKAISDGVALATGAKIETNFGISIPSVYNDPELTELVEEVCREDLGDDSVQQVPLPSMGGEDFSVYQKHIPGVMFRLGCVSDDVQGAHLHSPDFNIDEKAIAIGARLLAKCAIRFLQWKK